VVADRCLLQDTTQCQWSSCDRCGVDGGGLYLRVNCGMEMQFLGTQLTRRYSPTPSTPHRSQPDHLHCVVSCSQRRSATTGISDAFWPRRPPRLWLFLISINVLVVKEVGIVDGGSWSVNRRYGEMWFRSERGVWKGICLGPITWTA
jgi:hypothetical protein